MKSLIFDQSGTYLALGGTDVQIYICKQWTEILHFTGEEGQRLGGPSRLLFGAIKWLFWG